MLKHLDIEQQVEFINKEITKGKSVQVIAFEYYGIKTESGLRKKLNKLGYYRNGAGTPFVKNKDEKNQDKNNNKAEEEIKGHTQLHTQHTPIVKPVKSTHTQKGDKKGDSDKMMIIDLKNNNDFMEVIQRIEMLERNFIEIGCKMGDNAHPTDYIEENTLKTYVSNSKVIKKSIFLYPEIWTMLEEVTELFPNSTKQTIYNSLLAEVLEKYLKLYKGD